METNLHQAVATQFDHFILIGMMGGWNLATEKKQISLVRLSRNEMRHRFIQLKSSRELVLDTIRNNIKIVFVYNDEIVSFYRRTISE